MIEIQFDSSIFVIQKIG